MPTQRSAPHNDPPDSSIPQVRARLNAIAHDFNNLLTVVNGYSELLLKELPEGEVREQVLEIRDAGTRAAELNAELLSIVRPPCTEGEATFGLGPVAAHPQPEPPPAARKTLLVVDDEEGVRKLLTGVLKAAGYEVLSASDGHQAQKVLDSRDVDLVVMDLVMPNQEGIETISGLRRARPDVKIIAISGYGGTFLNVATRLGARAALAKPVGPDQLLRVVQETLAAE